jgi:hypothetical protein
MSFGPSAKLAIDALERVGSAQGFPLRSGELQKGEPLLTGSFEELITALQRSRHLRTKLRSRLFDPSRVSA